MLEFGKGKRREESILVDENTDPEFRQLLAIRGAKFSHDEMRYIFDSFGTSSVTLNWVQRKFQLMTVRINYKLILISLKEEHPDGVAPDYLN